MMERVRLQKGVTYRIPALAQGSLGRAQSNHRTCLPEHG